MKIFKIFKVYQILAENKWEAMDLLRKAEEDGTWKELFEGQYAKEEEDKGGWINGFKKQIFGK